MSAAGFFWQQSITFVISMAFEETSSHLTKLVPLVTLALEVTLVLATFCGKIGELERDRDPDCKNTFSEVFKSVFKRRALSDGESKFLFNFELVLLISLRVFFDSSDLLSEIITFN